jgi:hypothetical protein
MADTFKTKFCPSCKKKMLHKNGSCKGCNPTAESLSNIVMGATDRREVFLTMTSTGKMSKDGK